jgi:hypothetical protein
MDEQSLNEIQPKVRRAGKSGVAEEPRPNVTRGESAGPAEHEALENASEKILRAGEEASPATGKGVRQVENGLPWPFRTTRHALEQWTHFLGRAVERNARAADGLKDCCSVAGALQWQKDLVQSSVEDWLQTSFAAFGVSVRKGAQVKAASETRVT